MGKVVGFAVAFIVIVGMILGLGYALGSGVATQPAGQSNNAASADEDVSDDDKGTDEDKDGDKGRNEDEDEEERSSSNGELTEAQLDKIQRRLRDCMAQENQGVHYASWARRCLSGQGMAGWERQKGEAYYP